MNRSSLPLAILAAASVVAAAGCASTPACDASSCVASTAQRSLIGSVAKDNSVITKMRCQPSTVKQNAGGSWTVTCTATYSDGARYDGYATIVESKSQVAWEPTGLAG